MAWVPLQEWQPGFEPNLNTISAGSADFVDSTIVFTGVTNKSSGAFAYAFWYAYNIGGFIAGETVRIRVECTRAEWGTYTAPSPPNVRLVGSSSADLQTVWAGGVPATFDIELVNTADPQGQVDLWMQWGSGSGGTLFTGGNFEFRISVWVDDPPGGTRWVPLAESGIGHALVTSPSHESTISLDGSTVVVDNATYVWPGDGIGWNLEISVADAPENFTGLVRVTTQIDYVDAPESGPLDFQYSTEDGGSGVVNEHEDSTAFVPNPLVLGPLAPWSGNDYGLVQFTAWGIDVLSATFYIEVEVQDDGPPSGGCFWTDLLNVTQECEDDEDDEDQASYNILYDDGHTWTGGDGYDPYYLCVALPFNLSADVWTSYPATSTSVLEDKTDGYFGAYLFLFFGYNYPDSGWPGDRLFFVVRDTRTGTNLFTQDMEALGQSVVRMEIDFDVDLPAPAWAFEVGFAETENGPLISFANEPTYEVNSTRAMAIVHKKSRRGIRVDFIGVASSTPVENEVFRYGGEDVPFDGPPPLYDVSTAGLVGAMLLSEEPQRGDYVDSELFVWRPAHDPIWLDAGVSEGEFVLYDYNLMTALGLSDPVPPGTWVLGCFMHDHAPTFHRRGVLFIAFQVP